MKTAPVIQTSSAKCRDCYRCLRVCPVKSIRVKDNQASVIGEACLGCGTCIRECPQKAKFARKDLVRVLEALDAGDKIAVSLAPSAVGVFGEKSMGRLASALRYMGCLHVSETAMAAHLCTKATAEAFIKNRMKTCITTACPAIVFLVEKYYPELTPFLSPVASPMVIHGRLLKKSLGSDFKTLFIGPCTAKKMEADYSSPNSPVDFVLTYQELEDWMAKKSVSLNRCEESGFDIPYSGKAGLYPISGGMLEGMHPLLSAAHYHAADGFDNVIECLEWIRNSRHAEGIFELLMCRGGCLHGAGIPDSRNLFELKTSIRHYVSASEANGNPVPVPEVDSTQSYAPLPLDKQAFPEHEIEQLLADTGKGSPELQLNCGACGYPNCREKALAVLRGLAEPEMCVPVMRRLAEQRADKVMSANPNAMIILDSNFCVLSINSAFKKLFSCDDSILGMPVSRVMDSAPFEKMKSAGLDKFEANLMFDKNGKRCHVTFYPLEKGKQFAGIFIDLTELETNEQTIRKLREQSLAQARELMLRQVDMAQKMVDFLGESTAQTELLVQRISLLGEEKK